MEMHLRMPTMDRCRGLRIEKKVVKGLITVIRNGCSGSFHPQMRDHRMHDGGYRQSRNPDFFRQTPTAPEATNAGWQKSPWVWLLDCESHVFCVQFVFRSEAVRRNSFRPTASSRRPFSFILSATVSLITSWYLSNLGFRSNDKYQNPKSMYGAKQHDTHRKIGL